MISAVVCAAGKGLRAGFSRNKLLEEYENIPVIVRTVSAFDLDEIGEIVVSVSEEDERDMKKLLSPLSKVRLVRGGETRSESVCRAVKECRGEIVLVHDGARPFVSRKIILDCIDSVKTYGSGVCCLPATDTTVICEKGEYTAAPERESVFTVQTPQGFYREKLLLAFEKAKGKSYTDEGSLYFAQISPPRLFLGERRNRKLTFAEDFQTGERVGFGVDTHAFGGDRKYIMLGGVSVPSERGLVAHSDGDVLLHALMDALLSAAALRDIGYYFPDSDEKYRGADSSRLLETVLSLLREGGFAPDQVSVSVLAEKPRLSPYIEKIRENLSRLLEIPADRIGVAAGTNEKLGYVGEGKGITVYCYCRIRQA